MLYADYYNDEMFVIPPGEFCNVSAIASTYGLQAAIISDVHPTELYYSFDLWWVKTGATLTVTAVNSTDRVVTAHGENCESYGRDKHLYDSKRLTNFRMCLNIFKYYNSENRSDILPPDLPAATVSSPYFLNAPFLLIDNSLGTNPVKIMDVCVSFSSSLSSDFNNSITDIVSPFIFHQFAPITVQAYAYVRLPNHSQVIFPEDWELPQKFFSMLAMKHLRLHNYNRYTLLTDPGLNMSTVVVTSMLKGKEYMKIVPMDVRGLSNCQVLRLVLVLNVLTSCFQSDSDPYLAVHRHNEHNLSLSLSSGGGGGAFSTAPPDMAADLPAWFAFCDTSNSGSLSQEEIVKGLKLSFGKDLDEKTLDGMRSSVMSIWSQVFGDAIDFKVSEATSTSGVGLAQNNAIHHMKISLEVFMEEDGIGPTLAEYLYPLHHSLDHLFDRVKAVAMQSHDRTGRCILTLESGCAITRQHIYNILLAQNGDVDETWQMLQHMHPGLAAESALPLSSPHPPPQPSESLSPSPTVLLDEYTSLTHPAVRVCALAARDIYLCTSGNPSDGLDAMSLCSPPPPPPTGTGVEALDNDHIQWQHISSGKNLF